MHLPLYKSVHCFALRLGYAARCNRLSPRRQLVKHGNIQVPVKDQGKRARNGRCAHDERVRAFSLRADCRTLPHAKTVLFICNHGAEVVKAYAFGKQRMRADYGERLAASDGRIRRIPFLFFHAAQKQAGARPKYALCRCKMLLCKDFRGRHQNGLEPAFHRRIHCKKRHSGFATAHIALQKAVHLASVRHFPGNFPHGPHLRPRGREWEQL